MLHTKKICFPILSGEYSHYSDYVFYFLSNYYENLNISNSVCDVGCGRMRHVELFKYLGFKEIYACDKFKYKETSNVYFNKCDLESETPFQGSTFDIVLCNFILMFISPGKRAFFLDNLINLIRPGGYLVLEIYPTSRTRNTYNCGINEVINHYSNKLELLNLRKYGFIGRVA